MGQKKTHTSEIRGIILDSSEILVLLQNLPFFRFLFHNNYFFLYCPIWIILNFVFQKYDNFCCIFPLEHFIDHKPLYSEEWKSLQGFSISSSHRADPMIRRSKWIWKSHKLNKLFSLSKMHFYFYFCYLGKYP